MSERPLAPHARRTALTPHRFFFSFYGPIAQAGGYRRYRIANELLRSIKQQLGHDKLTCCFVFFFLAILAVHQVRIRLRPMALNLVNGWPNFCYFFALFLYGERENTISISPLVL